MSMSGDIGLSRYKGRASHVPSVGTPGRDRRGIGGSMDPPIPLRSRPGVPTPGTCDARPLYRLRPMSPDMLIADEGPPIVVGSAVHPRAAAGGELEDLSLAHHGRVTGGGHRQRAVCGAVLDGGLQRLTLQQSVDQPGRERVTPSHTVQDLQPAVGAWPARRRWTGTR